MLRTNELKQIDKTKPILPAYGKALVDRQRFKNPPFLVVVCIGGDCWNSAKEWQRRPDVSPLVLTAGLKPDALQWPVNGCLCLIEWGGGAPDALIIRLVQCLLRSGAVSVTVRPLWVDVNEPAGYYDISKPLGQRWIQTQETIKTYYPRKEVKNVA